MDRNADIKKPLIRQAGSAEAFAGSTAAGREHSLYTSAISAIKWESEKKYGTRIS